MGKKKVTHTQDILFYEGNVPRNLTVKSFKNPLPHIMVFDIGFHKDDKGYVEFKKGGREVARKYKDGCKLNYMIEVDGKSSGWKWVKYNH